MSPERERELQDQRAQALAEIQRIVDEHKASALRLTRHLVDVVKAIDDLLPMRMTLPTYTLRPD